MSPGSPVPTSSLQNLTYSRWSRDRPLAVTCHLGQASTVLSEVRSPPCPKPGGQEELTTAQYFLTPGCSTTLSSKTMGMVLWVASVLSQPHTPVTPPSRSAVFSWGWVSPVTHQRSNASRVTRVGVLRASLMVQRGCGQWQR